MGSNFRDGGSSGNFGGSEGDDFRLGGQDGGNFRGDGGGSDGN